MIISCGKEELPSGLDSNVPDGDREEGLSLFRDDSTFPSCATCHFTPDDTTGSPGHSLVNVRNRGIWWAGVNDDSSKAVLSLNEAVNVCLTNWMGREPISEGSEDWNNLDTYLASISPSSGGLIIDIDGDTTQTSGTGTPSFGQDWYLSTCNHCHGTILTGENCRTDTLTVDDLLQRALLDTLRSSGLPVEFSPDIPQKKMPFISYDILSNSNVNDLQSYIYEIADSPLFGNSEIGNSRHNYTCRTCHDFTPREEEEADTTRTLFAGGSLHSVSTRGIWWDWDQWDYDKDMLEEAVNLCIDKWMEGNSLTNYNSYKTYFEGHQADSQPAPSTPSDSVLSTFSSPTSDLVQIASIYTRTCIVCHGSAAGNDVEPLPNVPSLQSGFDTIESYYYIAEWVRRSGTGLSENPNVNSAKMPFYGDRILPDEMLNDLTYYIVYVINNGDLPPQ